MKFNLTIDIADYDDIDMIRDEVLQRIADKLFNDTLQNWQYRDNFEKQIKDIINWKLAKLEEGFIKQTLNKDYKKEVSVRITDELTNRFARTKEYREIVKDNEIMSDRNIKSGLKDIISNMVKDEIRKSIKLS